MFRLQGMDPTTFSNVIPEYQLGQLLGNAMSVNVIERLLFQVLHAATMIPVDMVDKRATGQHLRTLRSTFGEKLTYPDNFQYKPISSAEADAMPRFQGKIMPLRKNGRRLIVDSGASYHLSLIHI